jgi:hypothetical protein
MKYNIHQTVIFIDENQLQEGVIIRIQPSDNTQPSYVILFSDPDGNVFTSIADEEDIFADQSSAFEYIFSVLKETKARYMVKEFLQNISIRDYLQGVSLIELLKHKNLLNVAPANNNESIYVENKYQRL